VACICKPSFLRTVMIFERSDLHLNRVMIVHFSFSYSAIILNDVLCVCITFIPYSSFDSFFHF